MRIKRRLIVVCALTAIGSLAAASSAMGINANSTATAKFCLTPGAGCKYNNHGTFKNGKLNVHTHTDYSVGGTKTNRAQLYFDNQLKFNTTKVPVCSNPDGLAGLTMAQAMAACGNSLVGTGTAKATAATPQDTNACVLAFNSDMSAAAGVQPGIALVTRAGIIQPLSYLNNCASPATNTTGDATVLLKAPLGNTAGVTPGKVYGSSDAPVNKGRSLDFNNIAAASAFPLNDFNVWTGAGAPNTSLTGSKAQYIQARCLTTSTRPAAYKKKLALKVKFTYTSGSPLAQTTETKPYQSCS